MDLLCELNAREGQTILLVTHDPAIGERAGRVIRMRDGRLVDDVRQVGERRLAASTAVG
jgi:putative ABC transport system ATP-binding protein